ncbi:phosphate ABC transporter permease PstA [Nesterenkonia alkaliphila]|uniref:Phosphate transport system permease protein PstA n=1 Tax=Nesterenkonia alkaliphila TaxID=1463631 RepID=A0A7K1UME2_9MICC|nr:phosphate ABC transporter permease PstA [Nesterenkonia alkaliphila]MVT27637.1 phosphate ABC transporter permease PstA [Nesterenkonia alkaliphila]GFZ85725.1 phosphate transport system permease protein PstA [Nesterenkonia alkaliphila]
MSETETRENSSQTPTPASVAGPAGPSGQQDPSELIRPRSLTGNVLPKWFLPATAAVGVVVGFVISYLIGGQSVNYALWFVLAAIIYVLLSYLVTRQQLNKRKATDGLWRNLVYVAFVIALIPLISVIWSVVVDGFQGITHSSFWTQDMSQNAARTREQAIHEGEAPMGGGVLHAIIGSLLITLTATIISVPIGLLTSIYLVEYSRGGPLSRGITFFVDVMTGIPSIVAGLFGVAAMQTILVMGNQLGLWSYTAGNYSMGITAAIALCVLMIPVVVRTTEEMLRVVPNELREASYALGVRKWRTVLKVVIPTAISGIAAGVTLAIARVIGETAPILLTAGTLTRVNWDMFAGSMMSLPVYIYQTFRYPFGGPGELAYLSEQRAWGAALVLIMIVMTLNLIARIIANVFAPKKTGR